MSAFPSQPQGSVRASLMQAITTSDGARFSNALRDLALTPEGDEWPRQAVELALDARCWNEQSKEFLTQCVLDLLACSTPPRHTTGCRILEAVVGLDALDLWEPLVAAGFRADGKRIMAVILDRPGSRLPFRHRKAQWLENLLQSDFAPDPAHEVVSLNEYLVDNDESTPSVYKPVFAMEYALALGIDDLIPLLHHAGYVLPPTAHNRQSMAHRVSHGQWPFPNLILPDLMEKLGAREDFLRDATLTMAPSAFLANPHASFLENAQHVQWFCELSIPDRPWFCGKLMKVLKRIPSSPDSAHDPIAPVTIACLILLHDHQLLDLPALFDCDQLSPFVANMINATRPEFEARELHRETAPSGRPTSGHRL